MFVTTIVTKIIGTSNQRIVKKLSKVVKTINALEEKYGGEVNLKGLYSNKGWINRKDPNFLGGVAETPTSKKDFTF